MNDTEQLFKQGLAWVHQGGSEGLGDKGIRCSTHTDAKTVFNRKTRIQPENMGPPKRFSALALKTGKPHKVVETLVSDSQESRKQQL